MIETIYADGLPVCGSRHFDAEGHEVNARGNRKGPEVHADARSNWSGEWILGEEELGAAYEGVRRIWRASSKLRYVDWFDASRTGCGAPSTRRTAA